ncbi:amidohydrolase family protein [Biformimicrobium ophioploci]|uniref:Amidohydrolase family protein n=1 Tax=Biformimicrobium ophioploci TaxID=3036711 RepID=A0ABQ6M2D8_9GAMM|nr:amidohydrolase family protein [Microbulbifer sp. NKW57]GMG88493.1 amidohydrolase family protein [Microbulbifer sp. NKW57]
MKTLNRITSILLASAIALLALVHAETMLIKGAMVHTLSPGQDKAQRLDILVEDGKIARVAQDLGNASADWTIEAKGKVVTPGIIAPLTSLGLVEIGAASGTNDAAVADITVGPSFDPVAAFNPKSTLIPFNRAGGVTTALVTPGSSDKIFTGKSFVVNLTGSFDSVESRNVAQLVYFGERGSAVAGGSRAQTLAKVRDAISEAREYAANRAAIRRGEWRDMAFSINDLEALQPVARGEVPIIAEVHRASDILAVMQLARELNLRLVISGGAEAWMVAPQIAAAGVPVIIDAIDNTPESFSQLGARSDNAALLHKAGVKVVIAGPGFLATHNAYLARQSAGIAVAHGLPHVEALRSLSTNVADVFGIDGGTVAPGKSADLVIWSGDPLELTVFAETVLIDGKQQSLVNRSTRLRDRFLKPKQGHEFGYKF